MKTGVEVFVQKSQGFENTALLNRQAVKLRSIGFA